MAPDFNTILNGQEAPPKLPQNAAWSKIATFKLVHRRSRCQSQGKKKGADTRWPSWMREWRFRNSFNPAIKSLPVVHCATLPAYPPPAALNTQGMIVFLSLSKALHSANLTTQMILKMHWIPWALLMLAVIALAAALPMALRKPVILERIVEKVVERKVEVPVEVVRTNFITNTISVPLDKFVEIPAAIPAIYKSFGTFYTNYTNAHLASNTFDSLTGISAIKVHLSLDDSIKKMADEESARAKFELKLRQLGVPISEASPYLVLVQVIGMWDDNGVESDTSSPKASIPWSAARAEREFAYEHFHGGQNLRLTYSITTTVTESQTIAHDDAFHRVFVTIWANGSFGYAGKQVAPDSILKSIETEAEKFANSYLRANSEWLAQKARNETPTK
jgi:hypothetical protein